MAYRLTMTTTNTAAGFKKGDKVYWFTRGCDNRTGVCKVWAPLLTIQSWGKRQGTGMLETDGRMAHHRFYTEQTSFYRTKEEVIAVANTVGLDESERCITNLIRLQQEWLTNWAPKAKADVVERAKAHLLFLQEAVPSVVIKWD